MLQDVLRSLDASPRSLLGVSFSTRTMRYVHFEEQGKTYRVAAHGEVKIPFDVMKGSNVERAVEFTDMLRETFEKLDKNTRVFIKDDGDEIKADSFALLGFKDIRLSPLPESLISIAVPYGIYVQRLLLFVTWDSATLLYINGTECTKIGAIDTTIEEASLNLIMRDALSGIENDLVLYAGVFEEDFKKKLEKSMELEEVSVFQNIIDLQKHIPEILHKEVGRYTIPISLVAYGIHYDVASLDVDIEIHDEKDDDVQASTYFQGIEPMTKLEEDRRKKSESVRGHKYKKLMRSLT